MASGLLKNEKMGLLHAVLDATLIHISMTYVMYAKEVLKIPHGCHQWIFCLILKQHAPVT